MEEPKKNNGVIIGTVVALILAVGGYGFFKYTKKENATIEPISTPEVTKDDNTSSVTYLYKDGTYSATGNYVSPGGSEEVLVSLILKGDIVTDVTLTPKATRPISLQMQQTVSQNLKNLVVGKKLNEVTLDKVSGSSLSPKGFNDAVTKIKVSAKA
ncbi:MAG TPA: hypothetical protein VGC58_01325 [Candidatus Paceibacterota bacterium]